MRFVLELLAQEEAVYYSRARLIRPLQSRPSSCFAGRHNSRPLWLKFDSRSGCLISSVTMDISCCCSNKSTFLCRECKTFICFYGNAVNMGGADNNE